MKLELEGKNYSEVRKPVFSWLHDQAPKAPENLIADITYCVGEVLANLFKHGGDKTASVGFYYDLGSFAYVAVVSAKSHAENRSRISKLLFYCHNRRNNCDMMLTHGRGLDMVSCIADKVTLNEKGDMKLYFACMPPAQNHPALLLRAGFLFNICFIPTQTIK